MEEEKKVHFDPSWCVHVAHTVDNAVTGITTTMYNIVVCHVMLCIVCLCLCMSKLMSMLSKLMSMSMSRLMLQSVYLDV